MYMCVYIYIYIVLYILYLTTSSSSSTSTFCSADPNLPHCHGFVARRHYTAASPPPTTSLPNDAPPPSGASQPQALHRRHAFHSAGGRTIFLPSCRRRWGSPDGGSPAPSGVAGCPPVPTRIRRRGSCPVPRRRWWRRHDDCDELFDEYSHFEGLRRSNRVPSAIGAKAFWETRG